MKKLESNVVYHLHKAKGSTILKEISKRTLLHAVNKVHEESDAMDFGNLVHARFFEAETLESRFVVIPDDAPKRPTSAQLKAKKTAPDTIVQIEYWQKFDAENEGKTVVSKEDWDNSIIAVQNVLNHPIAREIFKGGEAEYSYYSTCKETGLEIKCRPDYFVMNSLIDLKTTRDASVHGFTSQSRTLGYHIQAAFYLDVFNQANGTKIEEFYFVAVENTVPFAVNVFKMPEAELALGRSQYKKALKELAEYEKDKTLVSKFGYKAEINLIQYPNFAFEEL